MRPYMFTRRTLVASLAAGLVPPALSALSLKGFAAPAAKPRPLVGAIRWDAWYAPGSMPTKAVENSLSPEKYRWRTPFFAKGDNRNSSAVSFPAVTQEEMDKEIGQAVFAGTRLLGIRRLRVKPSHVESARSVQGQFKDEQSQILFVHRARPLGFTHQTDNSA